MEPPKTLPSRPLDPASAAWIADLSGPGGRREDAVGRLHALLLRVTRSEVARRAARSGLTGPDVDDVAHQAAADATLAVLAKLDGFRGESRFATWVYAFAVFEVSAALGRRWRQTRGSMEIADEAWEILPDRLSAGPASTPQPRQNFCTAIVSTACSSSPLTADTADRTKPGKPSIAVAALPS